MKLSLGFWFLLAECVVFGLLFLILGLHAKDQNKRKRFLVAAAGFVFATTAFVAREYFTSMVIAWCLLAVAFGFFAFSIHIQFKKT